MQAYNMLYSDDQSYLILNIQLAEGSCFENTEVCGIYKIENGELYFDTILFSSFDGDFECTNSGVGNRIDYTGNLVVSKVYENEKQILKLLSKGGVEIEEYASELELISFENGVKKNEVCIGENNKFCSQDYGEIGIQVWSDDIVEVKFYAQDLYLFSLKYEFDWLDGDYTRLLPAGEYKIEFINEDGSIQSFEKVGIERGQYPTLSIDYNSYWKREKEGDGTYLHAPGIIAWDFLYSNSKLVNLADNEALQSYHVGVKGGGELLSSKIGNSKLLGTYGLDIDYNILENELDSIGSKEVKRTSYLGVYYSTDVFFRQYFTSATPNNFMRPYLDLGVSYKLPMYFRKNVAVEGFRYSEKWLHRFNEMVAYMRLGLTNNVALNVSYRPFNSLKNDLPDLPKLQFGLSITLQIY